MKGRMRLTRVGFATLAVLLVGTSGAAAAESPPELWTRCTEGTGPGQCAQPRGIATDPANGDLYIADQNNMRVVELDVWGEFVRTFGLKVNRTKVEGHGAPADIEEEEEENVCPVDPGDVCQAGSIGSAPSGFRNPSGPQGIAVDSAGDVFVVDRSNQRVQKFNSDGHFELMFGEGVDKGPDHPGDLCTAEYIEEGDTCGAGEVGSGPGQFGSWPATGSYIAVDTKGTSETSDDELYVGDPERIQRFDTGGHYQGTVPDPEGRLAAGQFIKALAAVPGGRLAVSFAAGTTGSSTVKPGVLSIDPSSGALGCKAEVAEPTALATDPAGNLYVADGQSLHSYELATLRKFDSSCKEDTGFAFESEGLEESTGIATGEKCFEEGLGLYVSNSVDGKSFARALGPPPDNTDCPLPPAAPPQIYSQYASSVGSGEAIVGAQINPRFWSGSLGETDYYVQYGTAVCIDTEGWEGGCVKNQPSPPGAMLISGVVNDPVRSTGVFLGGLQPSTRYAYRFVAEGDGARGEPVAGVGGEPGNDGAAGHFKTFAAPGEGAVGCPNEGLRYGPSAALPDCRAYEMVSPLDKEGGDIAVKGNTAHDQVAAGGGALTYSSYRAFGSAQSAPYSSQYIARRSAGGWASEGISPPQEGAPINLESFTKVNPFAVFTADLGEAWLQTAFEPQLAPGAVAEYDNIYRRQAGSGAYGACTTIEPSQEPSIYNPEVDGTASDGSGRVLLAVFDKLTEDAAEAVGIRQLYEAGCDGSGPVLVSVLPDGEASSRSSAAGTANGLDFGGWASKAGAVSSDGSRAYWTASNTQSGPGSLYLRTNIGAPESGRAHGAAGGAGNLIGPASGIGTVHASTSVSAVETSSGKFAVGQEVTDSAGKIPAGTTIVAIESEASGKLKLTLSAAGTGLKSGDELTGLASSTISGLTTTAGAFEAGQEIAATGTGESPIPPGATIISCAPECGAAATSITLSAPALATASEAALEAASPCIEAETKACTIALRANGSLLGSKNARFWAATVDGSEALFGDGLDVHAVGGLYRFDLQEALEGKAPERIAEEVTSVLGQSADLSRVYFISLAKFGGEGVEGQPNLFLYEEGEGGPSYRFIATLTGRDALQEGYSPANPAPSLHTARVTPGGGTVAFMSNSGPLAEQVAEYDNTDAQSPVPCGQGGGVCDAEIYLYEAASGETVCISCNPGGARPRGRDMGTGTPQGELTSPVLLPTWEASLNPHNPLSSDGRRLFFESYEPLVLSDTNGAADVYEWERPGTGSCTESSPHYTDTAGGCIELISTGKGESDSSFVDATPDGSEAFFTTAQSILESDPGLIDLYDARIDGGFPPPPPPPAGCEGQACQSPPPAPEPPPGGSSSYRGPGNLAPGCTAPARQAAKLSRRAKRLRRHSARVSGAKRARAIRRKAKRLAHRARRQSAGARRCRKAARRGK